MMSSANRRLLRRQNPEPASGAERTCDDRHYAPALLIARIQTSMPATTRGKQPIVINKV